MSEVEVTETLQALELALRSNDYSERGKSITPLILRTLVEGRTITIMRYKNTALVDAVIDLYIDEAQYEKRYANSLVDPEIDFTPRLSPGGEYVQEYIDDLADLASSTFDERLYDHVWGYVPPSGSSHRYFIATVFPEKTLTNLFTAHRGRTRNGQLVAQESLFIEGNNAGISIERAFDYIFDIVESNNDLGSEKRREIVSFIEEYSLSYSQQNVASKYREVTDYKVRSLALKILAKLGEAQDLPQVESVVGDSQFTPFDKRSPESEDLKILANKARIAIIGRD